jgi:phasin family protein
MFAQLKDFVPAPTLHVEAGLALVNTALESSERYFALNLKVSRSLFEQSLSNLKALQGARDVRSFVSLRAAQAQPAIDAAVGYSRSVCEIASAAKEETTRIVEVQLADLNADASDAIDRALQRAPAGSESAVAVIRTAIDAANSAYDKMNGAAQKVAEITEAHVIAVRQAGFQAAANAAVMGKKAA